MNKGRTRKGIVFAIAAAIFVLVLFIGGSALLNKNKNDVPEEPAEVIVEDNTPEPMPAELKNEWLANKAINPDFVGSIKFDSGLIDLPFVQAKDVYDRNGKPYTFYTEEGQLVEDIDNYTGNDVYIWTNWKTGEYDRYGEGGSVFMDYRNNLADQNLIVYGHHFSVWNDETRTKAFTPLEQLLEQENYEANRYVTLILENEIRHYEIACVYEFDATRQEDYVDLQYWRTNYNYDDYEGNAYDAEYYDHYIESARKAQMYETGVNWTSDDQTLTLQTCIGGHAGELFEIVVLRQISTETY